jgi:hypothetical protein
MLDEVLAKIPGPRQDRRIDGFPLGFIGLSRLQVHARTRAVDRDFSVSSTANRADLFVFGRAESLGGALCAEGTARHRAVSIPPENLR